MSFMQVHQVDPFYEIWQIHSPLFCQILLFGFYPKNSEDIPRCMQFCFGHLSCTSKWKFVHAYQDVTLKSSEDRLMVGKNWGYASTTSAPALFQNHMCFLLKHHQQSPHLQTSFNKRLLQVRREMIIYGEIEAYDLYIKTSIDSQVYEYFCHTSGKWNICSIFGVKYVLIGRLRPPVTMSWCIGLQWGQKITAGLRNLPISVRKLLFLHIDLFPGGSHQYEFSHKYHVILNWPFIVFYQVKLDL